MLFRVALDPDEIPVKLKEKPILLSDVKIFGEGAKVTSLLPLVSETPTASYEEISKQVNLEIPFQHNQLALSFSGFSYSDEKDHFYYRFEKDDSWMPLQRSQLILQRLHAGTHKIVIKSD